MQAIDSAFTVHKLDWLQPGLRRAHLRWPVKYFTNLFIIFFNSKQLITQSSLINEHWLSEKEDRRDLDACFGNRYCLLLHGLVDSHLFLERAR
jgi:hypothetical protein